MEKNRRSTAGGGRPGGLGVVSCRADRTDRQRAERLAADYGSEAASRRLRYHPVGSLDDLEAVLRKESRRIRSRVRGVYESIDVRQCPPGWTITNDRQMEAGGTLIVRTDVIGPNGATGLFERGFNAAHQRIELRNAFLRLPGATDELPAWVTSAGVPMVATKGTPTFLYFSLYQFKLLGVPAGQIRFWRRLLHGLRLRNGPFEEPGVVISFKMSTIQNVETIVHLHWLRRLYPGASLSELIAHTASVEYAETTIVQCGYRVRNARYVSAQECEEEIGRLLYHFEGRNTQRRVEHDRLLARYPLNRNTVMKYNFNIELAVEPA